MARLRAEDSDGEWDWTSEKRMVLGEPFSHIIPSAVCLSLTGRYVGLVAGLSCSRK